MPQQKYILSDKFKLLENPENPIERQFIMYNKAMEESILLNESIFFFLKNFEQANSLDAVTEVFATLTESSAAEVQPIIHNFWQQMSHRGVLLAYKKSHNYKNFEERNKTFPEGHLIDEFQIEKHLSSNVPLHVYLADDTLKNKKVILKILQFPKKISEKMRAHNMKIFEKEFHILRSIAHPNIVLCLDFRNDYAVIEYVEGEELYRKIKDNKEPGLKTRLNWLLQIFDAIAYLHEKNILHGDIHYKNALITETGTAKIIDFDLACFVDDPNTAIGGMRPFIPPERIDANAFEFYKNLPDFRSEVHQLGVLTYFVIYGNTPFREETWRETAIAICDNVPLFAEADSFGNLIPYSLKQFMATCLKKNPIERFSSATEALINFRNFF